MNDNENLEKEEDIQNNKEVPGYNGNFNSLIPNEKESREGAEKCISAYKAFVKARQFAKEYGGLENGTKE